jgi:hypothetical protein
MELDLKKNQLLLHHFNNYTELISKLLDELLFGLLKKLERVVQPMVDETFVHPVGWVHHLMLNIGKLLNFLDTMILILSVLRHLYVCYKPLFLLAACFYAKNVVLCIFCLVR